MTAIKKMNKNKKLYVDDSSESRSGSDNDESVYETMDENESGQETDTDEAIDTFIHGKKMIQKGTDKGKGKGNGNGKGKGKGKEKDNIKEKTKKQKSKKRSESSTSSSEVSPKKYNLRNRTQTNKKQKKVEDWETEDDEDDEDFVTENSEESEMDSEDSSDSDSEEEELETEEDDESVYDSSSVSVQEKKSKKSSSKKDKKEKSKSSSKKDRQEKSSSKKDKKEKSKKEGGGILVMNMNNLLDAVYEDDGEEYEEDEFAEEYETDSQEEVNSDDEKMFMKEKFPESEISEWVSKEKKKKQSVKDSSSQTALSPIKLQKTQSFERKETEKVDKKYQTLDDMRKFLKDRLEKDPNNKILKNALQDIKENIHKLVKQARSKNAKKFHDMVAEKINGNNKINDMEYFKKKLSNKEQIRAMQDLKEINEHIYLDKPYRMAILEMDIPFKHKAVALSRLDTLKQMEQSMESGGSVKMKEWIDTFMRIPFGKYKNLPVQISDGAQKCRDFMFRAKKILDECTYGLNDAKMQIMQVLGTWISNPTSMGTAIAIKGPPGTGKTTLVRDGISRILGREFAFITLGGATDASYLDGFSYTYEGSKWGKIVQILLDSKSMNPVIYFDELDKISTTDRGQEITGLLTHLTDTSQNNQFHDKYFSEVDFDLSRCLFIFSYNEESLVNPILKDRMYVVETKGYSAKEKVIIAQKYLMPTIRKQVFFQEDEIIVPDETIQYLVEKEEWTGKEEGVRNLKRCLEIVFKKLNLLRLMGDGFEDKLEENASSNNEDKDSSSKKGSANTTQLFGEEFRFKVTFPFTVKKEHIDALIKKKDVATTAWQTMFV